MPPKKKISPQATPFLKTAAEAIGTALGKLAVKTGVATPVVASDIDGYREVMTPEAAVAFPPGNVAELVGAVVSLLEDEPRRAALGAEARHLAIERYSWEDIARRLHEIYEQVAA